MAEVTPITQDTLTLSDRSVFTMIQEKKWAFISENGHTPRFIIVGGNYLTRLQQEIKESPLLRLREAPFITLHGLVLVKTEKHMIEVGE